MSQSDTHNKNYGGSGYHPEVSKSGVHQNYNMHENQYAVNNYNNFNNNSSYLKSMLNAKNIIENNSSVGSNLASSYMNASNKSSMLFSKPQDMRKF